MASKTNNKDKKKIKFKKEFQQKVSMYKTFERYVFCMHRKQVQSYKAFIDTFFLEDLHSL